MNGTVFSVCLLLGTTSAAQDLDALLLDPKGPAAFPVTTPGLRPDSAIIFSGDELRQRGYRTLGDALTFVLGVDAGPSSLGMRYGMRGIPNGLLLVVDGVPQVFEGERNALNVDAGLDLTDVERIEIIRGPVSAVTGALALAGVVRVSTKRPGLTGGRLAIGGTHLGQTELGGDATYRVGNFAIRAVALHRTGQQQVWQLQNVPTRYIDVGAAVVPSTKINTEIDADDDTSSLARLAIAYGDWRLDAGYGLTDEHTPLSTFSHALLADGPQQRQFRERTQLRLRWGHRADAFDFQATAWGAHHVRIDRIMLFPPKSAYPFGGRVSTHGSVWAGGLATQLDVPLTRDHRLLFSGLFDLQDHDAYSDAFDPIDGEKRSQLVVLNELSGDAVLAIEYQGDLGHGWHTTGGIGLLWHTGFSWAVVPRAAVIFVPVEELSLRLAYAEGSRAPDRFDMAGLSQAVVDDRIVGAKANPNLKPEHTRTGEVGLTFRPGPRVRVTLDGFVIRHENAVAPISDDATLMPANLPPRLVAGTEALADFSIARHVVDLQLGAATAQQLSGPSPEADQCTATAGVTTTPIASVTLGTRARSVWRRSTPGDQWTPLIADVYATYIDPDTDLKAHISLRNVLDRSDTVRDPLAGPSSAVVAIPGPGRTLFLLVEGTL